MEILEDMLWLNSGSGDSEASGDDTESTTTGADGWTTTAPPSLPSEPKFTTSQIIIISIFSAFGGLFFLSAIFALGIGRVSRSFMLFSMSVATGMSHVYNSSP